MPSGRTHTPASAEKRLLNGKGCSHLLLWGWILLQVEWQKLVGVGGVNAALWDYESTAKPTNENEMEM